MQANYNDRLYWRVSNNAVENTIHAGVNDRFYWGYDTGTSQSVPLSGPIQMAIYEECPQAQYTGICLEFGTLPLAQMILAMRADHWLALHPEAAGALQERIRSDMLQAFNPPSGVWQAQVWQQGLQAARQALQGLAESA